jgi:hypothetical protein
MAIRSAQVREGAPRRIRCAWLIVVTAAAILTGASLRIAAAAGRGEPVIALRLGPHVFTVRVGTYDSSRYWDMLDMWSADGQWARNWTAGDWYCDVSWLNLGGWDGRCTPWQPNGPCLGE